VLFNKLACIAIQVMEALQDKDLALQVAHATAAATTVADSSPRKDEVARDKYYPPHFYYLEEDHGGGGEEDRRSKFGVDVGTRQRKMSSREPRMGGWEGHANNISDDAAPSEQGAHDGTNSEKKNLTQYQDLFQSMYWGTDF